MAGSIHSENEIMKKLVILMALFISSTAYATVSNTSNTVTYSGNGSTTHFSYAYPLQYATDIQVWITDAAGNQTMLSTNYQVDTLNSQVIYPTTGSPLPADGSKITLLRVVPLTQTLLLTNTGPLPPVSLMNAYDKLTMAVQQYQEQLSRTLQYPVGTVQSSTDTASLLAEIQASSGNAISAAASAALAAHYVSLLSTPIPVSNGGTGSSTTLNNGYFMQSSGGKIVESNVTVATFAGFLPGMSVDYRGSSAPSGWLLEDGTSYPTSTYPALFAVIGYTYGGSGANFNVPDSRGRVNVGAGTGPGLSARTVGQTFGEETHQLTLSEMPTHSHGVNDPGHTHSGTYAKDIGGLSGSGGYGISGVRGIDSKNENAYVTPQGIPVATTGISIQSAGGNGAHNNMQPSIVSTRIIKY